MLMIIMNDTNNTDTNNNSNNNNDNNDDTKDNTYENNTYKNYKNNTVMMSLVMIIMINDNNNDKIFVGHESRCILAHESVRVETLQHFRVHIHINIEREGLQVWVLRR